MKTVYECEMCLHVHDLPKQAEVCEDACKKHVDGCKQRFYLCLDCMYHNRCKRYSDQRKERNETF